MTRSLSSVVFQRFILSVFSLFPMHFRPEQHLRRQDDFRDMRTLGRRIDRGVFTLWWRRRGDATAVPPAVVRVGVVASIAAVGPAVRRNAAKRRLREVFRRHQDLVPRGTDLLLVARAALIQRGFAEVEAKFVDTCQRIAADQA
jgi:ribonuclease P protein component